MKEKKINGMYALFFPSEPDYFCRMFRGYTITKDIHGMYETRLEHACVYFKADTIEGIKKAIRKDIKGNRD